MEASLLYLAAVMQHAPSNFVSLARSPSRPVLVYTDASLEKGVARLGAWVLVPGARVRVLTYDVSERLLSWRGPSEHIINQIELLTAPVLAVSAPGLIRNRDVLWFIDNSAAESALVKAGSPTQTMSRFALVASACLGRLRCRPRYDHVASADNPADALSRGGREDPEVAPRVASGAYVVVSPVEPPTDRLEYQLLWGSPEGLGLPL